MPTIDSRTSRTIAPLPALVFVLLVLLALLLAPLAAGPAGAAAQASCRLVPHNSPSSAAAEVRDLDLADDYWHLAFSQQLEEDGPIGVLRSMLSPPGSGGPSSSNQLASLDDTGTSVSINDLDGTIVWFTSTDDVTGGNPDGNREIFRSAGGTVVQVTDTTGGGSLAHLSVTTNADGTDAAFLSNRAYGSNADSNLEVVALVDGTFHQLTSTIGASANSGPDITDSGTSVVFGSIDDYPSTDNADGNPEIFRWTLGALFMGQITNTTDVDWRYDHSVGDDGSVAFASASTQHTGTNADGNTEIFLARGGQIEQITQTTVGHNDLPELNAEGTALTFISSSGLGGPPSGSAYFATRWARVGGFTRLDPVPAAGGEGGAAWPSIDGIGAVAAVASTANVGGTNPDGGQDVYQAQCRTFTDVSQDHPFWLDVEWMTSEGITTGYADGRYQPSAPVTRQAMSAFLYRIAGSPAFSPPASPTFDDVGTGNPFFAEVEWMQAEGITTGYPDGGFHPLAPVSRGAMSAFMYRLEGASYPPATTTVFSDVPVSHAFATEIGWMADMGISEGYEDGTFRPSASVSRQAMSAFLHRLVDPLPAPQ